MCLHQEGVTVQGKEHATRGILEVQRISIPIGTRSSYDLVNFYVPLVRGEGAAESLPFSD